MRMKKGEASRFPFPLKPGAGDESRTRDLNLGKVALYQLSYSRIRPAKDLNCTRFFGIGKSSPQKKAEKYHKHGIQRFFFQAFSGVFRRFEAEERLQLVRTQIAHPAFARRNR